MPRSATAVASAGARCRLHVGAAHGARQRAGRPPAAHACGAGLCIAAAARHHGTARPKSGISVKWGAGEKVDKKRFPQFPPSSNLRGGMIKLIFAHSHFMKACQSISCFFFLHRIPFPQPHWKRISLTHWDASLFYRTHRLVLGTTFDSIFFFRVALQPLLHPLWSASRERTALCATLCRSPFPFRDTATLRCARRATIDRTAMARHTRVSWPSCNGMPNTFTRPVTEKIRINNFRSNESFDVACGRRNVNLPATFFNA